MSDGQHYNQAGWIGEKFSMHFDSSKRGRFQIVKWININKLREFYDKLDIKNLHNELIAKKIILDEEARTIFADKRGFIDKKIEEKIGINDKEYHPHERNFFTFFEENAYELEESKRKLLYNQFIDFVSLHSARNLITYLDFYNEFKMYIMKRQPLENLFYPEYKEFLLNHPELISEYGSIKNKNTEKKIKNFSYKLFNFYYPLYMEDRKKNYKNLSWNIIPLNIGTIGIGDISVFDFTEPYFRKFLENPLLTIGMNHEVLETMKESILVIMDKNKILLGITKKRRNEINQINQKYGNCYFENEITKYLSIISFLTSQRHYVIPSDTNYKYIENYLEEAYKYLNHNNIILYK